MNLDQYSLKGRPIYGRIWSVKMDVHRGIGGESQVRLQSIEVCIAIFWREEKKK